MFDIDELAAQLAEKIADEVDEQIPDGMLQTIAGEAIKIVGEVLSKAGSDLAGVQNTDEDA